MSKTRLEISISFADSKGVKRYRNNLGSLWIDTETMRGSIELPPGMSLGNPGPGAFINVQPPLPPKGDGEKGGW